MTTLKKTFTAALAALTLSGAVLASADPAEARPGRRGGAIAAGVIGGIALGAAIAAHRPAYAYEPVYGYAPALHLGVGGRLRRLRAVRQAAREGLPLTRVGPARLSVRAGPIAAPFPPGRGRSPSARTMGRARPPCLTAWHVHRGVASWSEQERSPCWRA
jgi:hypothetical protein